MEILVNVTFAKLLQRSYASRTKQFRIQTAVQDGFIVAGNL